MQTNRFFLSSLVLSFLFAAPLQLHGETVSATAEERVEKALADVSKRLQAALTALSQGKERADEFNSYLEELKRIEALTKRTEDPETNVRRRAEAIRRIVALPKALQFDFTRELELLSGMEPPTAGIARELLLDLGTEKPQKKETMPSRKSERMPVPDVDKDSVPFKSGLQSVKTVTALTKSCPTADAIRAARKPLVDEIGALVEKERTIPERTEAKKEELEKWKKEVALPVLERFGAAWSALPEYTLEFADTRQGREFKDEELAWRDRMNRLMRAEIWSEPSRVYRRRDAKAGEYNYTIDRILAFLKNPPVKDLDRSFRKVLERKGWALQLADIENQKIAKLSSFKLNESARQELIKILPLVKQTAIEEGKRIADFYDVKEGVDVKPKLSVKRAELAKLDAEISGICALREGSFQAIEKAATEPDSVKAAGLIADQEKPLREVLRRHGELPHPTQSELGTHLP